MKKIALLVPSLVLVALVSCSSTYVTTPIKLKQNNIESKLVIEKSGSLNSVKLSYTYTESETTRAFNADVCNGLNADTCSKNMDMLKNDPIFATNSSDFSDDGGYIVDGYKINYTAVGAFGERRNLSGSILVPQMDTALIKGVVLFFAPTIVGSTNALSYTFRDGLNMILAKELANQGYIVVSSDYIGMGDDGNVPHPYVIYPRENTNAALSMLVAFRNFANSNNLPLPNSPLNLYVAGFSEGGAYALWFNKLSTKDDSYKNILASNGYQLKHTVAIDGAYDVSNYTYGYLMDNVQEDSNKYNVLSSKTSTFVKPSLLSAVLVSYGYYSSHISQTSESDGFVQYNNVYNNLFNPSFLYMNCSWYFGAACKLDGNRTNLVDFFMKRNDDYLNSNYSFTPSQAKFFLALYKSAYDQSLSESGPSYGFDNNSAKALVNLKLLSNKNFLAKMKQSNIYSYTAYSPITLLSLEKDSVVPVLNYREACANIKMANGTQVQCILLDNNKIKVKGLIGYDPIDHPTGFGYLLFVARSQFESSK